MEEKTEKTKIIIDTDIGDDADDALAICLAVKSRQLEILGITTVFRNTAARAKIAVSLLRELAGVQAAYKKVAAAMEEVRATGYGIVIPDAGELELEEPEIIKQGGRYGVRLRAKAPSIHMIRADIQAEVSPIVGSEKQSEDMLGFLLQEFEGEPERIWQSNIFGRSFHELINEDLASKLKHMPEDAREKMRQTLEKIINEGSGGLICIIL